MSINKEVTPLLQVLNPLNGKCIYSVLNYFFSMLAARKRRDDPPLHLPDGCTWGTLGLSRKRHVSSPIMEFLPLPKYAYSLKPICGAKLVTAYLV